MSRPVVCVVGAGTAGLEALLAAREAIGSTADLQLIAPDRSFRYRPMSPGSLFRPAMERVVAIADLVEQACASWVEDRAAAVLEGEGMVLTRDGETVDFDYLLLALGARPKRTLSQGYVWQRGADPTFLDEILAGIVSGEVGSVAVVAPRGARWPLPAYELALVMAWTAAGIDARVTLITAEERPLASLGSQATDTVVRELDAAGVETVAGMEVVDESPGGREPHDGAAVVLLPEQPTDLRTSLEGTPTDPASVRASAGSPAKFDRLIALPTVDGPFLAGVASDVAGFVEVDEGLKVCGSERVWAAGSCIAAALEHSGLGAQQADSVVASIAAEISGGRSARTAPAPELTGMLLAGQRTQWLRENPPGTRQPSTRCLWWPPGRAVGQMLAKRIAAWDPAVDRKLPEQNGGRPIRSPVALGCSGMPSGSTDAEVSADVRAARLRDIEMRQLMAVRRRELESSAELRSLEARLADLTAHQHEVVRVLQQHGYLTHRESSQRRPAR